MAEKNILSKSPPPPKKKINFLASSNFVIEPNIGELNIFD